MEYGKSHEIFSIFKELNGTIKKIHPKVMLHPGEFFLLTLIHRGYHEHCFLHKSEDKENKSCTFDKDINWNGITIGELCEKSGNTKPAISKMIHTLEEKEYVFRQNSKEDRRVVYIQLTEKGKQILDETYQVMFRKIEDSLNIFGEEKTTLLIQLMQELNNSILQCHEEAQRMNENE